MFLIIKYIYIYNIPCTIRWKIRKTVEGTSLQPPKRHKKNEINTLW